MRQENQNYTVNDWVKPTWIDANVKDYYGFINQEWDISSNGYDVFLPFHTLEDFISGIRPSRIGYEDLEKLPLDIRTEDIYAMIDLALQAKDEMWFNELNKMLVRSDRYVER